MPSPSRTSPRQQTAGRPDPGGCVLSPDDGAPIELALPAVAAVLAWILPGLGHLYQGRTFKGGLFMATLGALLGAGLVLGEGRVVYASWKPGESRLAFLGQFGIGAVAVPAMIQSWRLAGPAREPLFSSPLLAPPLQAGQLVTPRYAAAVARREKELPPGAFVDNHPLSVCGFDQLSVWHERLGRFYEIGTLYTVLAGLLNLLVIYDACGGPLADPREDHGDPAS